MDLPQAAEGLPLKMKVLEVKDVIDLLRAEVRRAGGQAAWAKQAGANRIVVNKILNGQLFDYPDAAEIWIDPSNSKSGCTGQLIGPFAMITAAVMSRKVAFIVE